MFSGQVLFDKARQVSLLQVEFGSLVLDSAGHQQVVDQPVQALAVALHHGDHLLQLLRLRFAHLDRFQLKLDRGERRFQLVGDLVDEMALGPVERGLAAPVEEDDIDADQNGDQKHDPLGQDQPVGLVGQQLGLVAGRDLLELLVAAEEPVDPEDQYQDP